MLTKATLFELLSVTRRRDVIRLVNEKPENAPAEFATIIAAAEDGVPIGEHNRKTRGTVYNTVTYTHLPRLDDHGVVEFDEATKSIRRGRHFDLVASALGAVDAAVAGQVEPDPIEAVIREARDE